MSTSTNDTTNPNVLNLLNLASKNLNVSNPKFDVVYTAKKGDGYMSIIYNVKIKDGEKEIISVIVKISPESKIFRQQSYIKELYSNEVLFYNEICPAFRDLQKRKGIENPFELAPKCFATVMEDEKEGLVLENLREKGFKLWNRMVPMDENHIELTLKGYAKFHALSIAFKDQHKEQFESFRARMNDIFELYDSNSMNKDSFEKLALGMTSYFDPIADKEYLDKFVKYLESMKDTAGLFYSKNMDEYCVITHGDGWCNNMMYKYEDLNNSSKPTDMSFLDFQIINYNSPISDFTHFFYTSTDKKTQDNVEYYIDLYYKTLSDFVKQLGSDPNKVFPRSIFDAHWNKYCRNGINVAMFMIKIMTSESDEVPDFTKTTENDSILDVLSYEPKNSGYKQRIKDIIIHFCEKGFI